MPRFARPIVALVCLAVLALPAAALTDDDVSVDYRDGTYIGSLSVRTPAPVPVVMAVLTDFNGMADFMPGLTGSRIVTHRGNQYQIEQKGKISFGPFSMPSKACARSRSSTASASFPNRSPAPPAACRA